jgi:hypothetical protein
MNILTSPKIGVRGESIPHFDYAVKVCVDAFHTFTTVLAPPLQPYTSQVVPLILITNPSRRWQPTVWYVNTYVN